MRKRNAHLSGFTWPEEKEQFEELASENGISVSDALHRLVLRANKTGKLPK